MEKALHVRWIVTIGATIPFRAMAPYKACCLR